MMDSGKREAYQEKTAAQLKQWNGKITQLLAEAEQSKADAKIEVQERLDQLRSKSDTISNRLEELKSASGEKWDDLRDRLDSAKEELGDGIERAYGAITDS